METNPDKREIVAINRKREIEGFEEREMKRGGRWCFRSDTGPGIGMEGRKDGLFEPRLRADFIWL